MVVISPEGVDTPSGMANLPVTIRSDEPIVINGREYYGHMVVTGEYLVNVVPLELYLHGVIASEMSHSWPLEALKAQAVASRTFACRKLLLSRNDPYDLRDTEMDQKYLLSQAHPALDRAVQGTHGQILMYGGEPIEAFFHSCSGGRTEASGDVFQADLPYLRSIPDPVCREERFEWSCTLRLDEITSALGLQPGVKQVRAGEKTSSGRVKEFELLLENGSETTVAGNRFRLAVGPTRLRSLLILDMAAGSDSGRPAIVFRGRGYGHGVGMSQWGARAMAESGRGYRTILGHYYRGVRIGMVWDIL
jgi:stage II sporulation protein D